MTVFKSFFKIMKEYKYTLLLYIVILTVFGAFSLQTSDTSMNFTTTKPDVLIINNDNDSKITENLYNYIKDNANIKEIENDEEKIKDALFYRDVNYIITIPSGYTANYLNGNNTQLEVKSTHDANAEYMEMLLERYLKIANIYQAEYTDENLLIEKINSVLKEETKIELASEIDTDGLDRATFYYNFSNYSMLAGCVFVISTVLNSFRNEKINKRVTISSFNYKKYNRQLFFAGTVFGTTLWIIYAVISFILIKDAMFSYYGLLYLLNSFVFMLSSIALAFLIGNLISDKEAINGLVNVIALGSSFLCGAFVPTIYLPTSVLNISKIFPSYWFIQNNELIKRVETFTLSSLNTYILNFAVIVLFIIIFTILTNIVTKHKRRTN